MSDITFRCPACGATHKSRNPLPAGKSVRCVKCQAAFRVQPDGAGIHPAPPPGAATSRRAERPQPAPPSKPGGARAKRPTPDDEDDGGSRVARKGTARGGSNLPLILVGVGLAALLLCCAPVGLLTVLWFGASAAPSRTTGATAPTPQADLRREIVGRWSSDPDFAIHEFLPDGLYVLHLGDLLAAGSYTFVNDNEIDLVTSPRPELAQTLRIRLEINNGELTLTSADGSKREVCRRVPDPPAVATEAQLTGAWVGAGRPGEPIELELTAGKQFHQTTAGVKTSGTWRLAGVNLLERKYPTGLPADYATVRPGTDTLELVTQDGLAMTFKRHAGGPPTPAGPGVELKKRKTLAKQDEVFDGVAVSPDGKLLAARTHSQGTISLVPVDAGATRSVAVKDPVDRLVFSPDGKTLALGHAFSGKVRFLDVGAETLGGEMTHPDKRFMEIAYLPDGGLLMIGPNQTIVWDAAKGAATSTVATPKSRGIPLFRVAAGGQFVACPGEKPGEMITWDPRTGKGAVLVPGAEVRFARVERIAISVDGAKVAVEGPDQGVELWDAVTRKRFGTIKAGLVQGLAFSPDGRFLVCSDRGGGITFWDVATQKAVGRTDTQSTPATKLCFTAGGKGLIPYDDNAKEIHLWDVIETK